ncbi:hypothetical protein HanRHA438_Chr16g0764751 [Helianthus annuus]|nr:hypothetical protein HanRHA438_Chr16g0764751 [Helianthus annuus]
MLFDHLSFWLLLFERFLFLALYVTYVHFLANTAEYLLPTLMYVVSPSVILGFRLSNFWLAAFFCY